MCIHCYLARCTFLYTSIRYKPYKTLQEIRFWPQDLILARRTSPSLSLNMKLALLLTASLPLTVTTASNLTTASNVSERTPNATTDDGFILNFSLTIEYLQRAFFAGGLASFQQKDFVNAGFEDPFYDNLQQIYADEQNHVVLLQNVLLAADIQVTSSLTYDFPYVDVSSFVALASIISGVSVSA